MGHGKPRQQMVRAPGMKETIVSLPPVLDGLTVLELGAGSLSASLAGMQLADNGARVIKLEPPEGDRLRDDAQSGFLVWNRGKESMVVDLRTAAGQAEARTLAADVDIVIEAFGPGVAERWGIDYQQLRDSNPGLVYCTIRGFGTNGLYTRIPGYEGLVAAKSGVYSMGMFGFRDGPIFAAAPTASIGAGLFAFAGVMNALLVREQTGKGQQVDANLWQGLNPYDYCGVMMHQYAVGRGLSPTPTAGMFGRVVLVLKTKDGRWVVFNFVQGRHAQAVSRALGRADTIEDPRFANQPFFVDAETTQEWEDLLWDAFATKTYEAWEPILLSEIDLGFELLRTSEEGIDHPQVQYNQDVIVVQDEIHGPVLEVAPLVTFDEAPARVIRSAPRLGQNNGQLRSRRESPNLRSSSPPHPLEGVTILESGFLYAMPFGTTLAAAMGARVIKIEDRVGDPARFLGTPDVWAAKVMEGKESISIDLRSQEGVQIAHSLLERADVFVTGFRSPAVARLGLDYQTARTVNPHLMYISAPGYGLAGPYGGRPMYAHTAAAIVGAYHRFASDWLDPKLAADMNTMEAQAVLAPRLRAPTDGDATPPMAVFSAILLALYAQRRGAGGQHLSTNMIRSNALALADDFCLYDGKPMGSLPDEENYGLSALYRLYRASEGWIFLAAPHDKEWKSLAVALDRVDLLRDDRFSSVEQRRAHNEELVTVLQDVFRQRPANEWEGSLLSEGVGCVQTFDGSRSEFTCTDPVLRETGLVTEVSHPLFGPVLRHGLPVAMSETPGRIAPGCMRGQHTLRILAELGYSEDEISELAKKEIVFPATEHSSVEEPTRTRQ
jgi:crotonobetainyl-CoA:carnitine CoA-transferase CaiB-like acyl-CoA transferase